jgi:hypothetical protein
MCSGVVGIRFGGEKFEECVRCCFGLRPGGAKGFYGREDLLWVDGDIGVPDTDHAVLAAADKFSSAG